MTESKHYYDFTNELSADEIYEGLNRIPSRGQRKTI